MLYLMLHSNPAMSRPDSNPKQALNGVQTTQGWIWYFPRLLHALEVWGAGGGFCSSLCKGRDCTLCRHMHEIPIQH